MPATGKRVKISIFVPCAAFDTNSINAADKSIESIRSTLSAMEEQLAVERFDVTPGRAKA